VTVTRFRAVCALVLFVPLLADAAAFSDGVDEDDILEAVFRQQIPLHLDETARAQGLVVCLGVDPGDAPQSVSREFLARFRHEPAVRRSAECEERPAGAVERTSGAPAVILTGGPVEWIARDEAWVRLVHFRDRGRSSVRTYRVVLEPAGWVCLGQIIRQACRR
jgi:hypothetical protein